jgi:hypothetical protein
LDGKYYLKQFAPGGNLIGDHAVYHRTTQNRSANRVHIFLLRAAGDQQEFDAKLSGEELANILLVACCSQEEMNDPISFTYLPVQVLHSGRAVVP